jgi:hypothetical protein
MPSGEVIAEPNSTADNIKYNLAYATIRLIVCVED